MPVRVIFPLPANRIGALLAEIEDSVAQSTAQESIERIDNTNQAIGAG